MSNCPLVLPHANNCCTRHRVVNLRKPVGETGNFLNE